MKLHQCLTVVTYAVSVAGHGYVRSVSIDGAVYPAFFPSLDTFLGAKRIAYGYNSLFNVAGRAAIMDTSYAGMACNALPISPPGLTAPARAGSDVIFRWSDWIKSHQGPLTTWLAPYTGDISKVDVNKLEFFKIHEMGVDKNNVWATDKLMANNGSWPVTLPWDIKPGTYVMRHELLALHFATEHSNYKFIPGGFVAPQFYISCYSLNITGDGTVIPPGATFPGAYKKDEPGLVFDIFVNNTNYPIPGPKSYSPSGEAPKLKPKAPSVVSPLGDPAADLFYKNAMELELAFFGSINDLFYRMGG